MRGRTLRFEQRDNNNREGITVPSKRDSMVAFSFFFIFCSLILLVQPSSSSTPQQPSNFTDFDLIGDAHVLDSHVRLTRPTPSSSGLLRRRQPLTFSAAVSLSTEFSFAVSGNGDGIILVLTPAAAADAEAFSGNISDYVGIEFDTSKNDNVKDINANHVGIDIGSHVSVAVANVSDVNLVLNDGEKLNAWVDYESDSKTLEVRLTKWGEEKPNDSIVSHSIDLFRMWGGNPVYAGLGSSNGANSAQVVSVYSWRLNLREGSKGLDSPPAGAHGLSEEQHKKLCPLTVLAGVIFGTGCVALLTFVVLFMWVIFFNGRDEESLVKLPDHPSEVRYERIDVAVDKNSHDDES